ncbi:MAG TPA: GC-type dockerin domain-anchored protein [Phycisphaerales bacterium]|nr:GC-type dockerin domain-anchored protein [Phycisphaerales bacterium]
MEDVQLGTTLCRLLFVFLCSLIAAPAYLFGQPLDPNERARCFKLIDEWRHKTIYEIEVDIDWGGWSVTSAPSSVLTAIIGTDGGYICCDAVCVGEGSFDSTAFVFIGSDDDAADLVDRSILAGVVYQEGWNEVYRSASVNSLDAYQAITNRFYKYEDDTAGCCYPCREWGYALISGYSVSIRNYEVERTGPGDMSYTKLVRFCPLLFYSFKDDSGCCIEVEPECHGDRLSYEEIEGREYAGVTFISTRAVFHYDEQSNTPPSEHILQGVHAVKVDGSIVRLGFFTDSEFDEFSETNGFGACGTAGIHVVVDDDEFVRFEETIATDTFGYFDGDIDRSGDLDCADRVAFFYALNTLIGEDGYNARADFDLDGDVDNDDRAAFGWRLCFADFNCDGDVNTMDYLAFLNAWAASDPSADYNGDGVVNSVDITVFLNDYNAGCP